MHEGVTLIRLTHEALCGHLPALIQLDAEVRAEMGDIYSSERWGEQEFKRDLPGKWDMSVVALGGNGAVCAFLIASVKRDTTLYVHRLAVKASYRGRAVGSTLLRTVAQTGAARGLDRMALAANCGNTTALGFYRLLGFKEMPAAAIANAVFATAPAANVAMDQRRLEINIRELPQA